MMAAYGFHLGDGSNRSSSCLDFAIGFIAMISSNIIPGKVLAWI